MLTHILKFLRNWTLPVAMVIGATGYLAYAHFALFNPMRPYAATGVSILQPTLIFCMLFLTFCKVHPRELHFCRWHLWISAIQILSFLACILALQFVTAYSLRIAIMSALLCFICPTATAAAVVTAKLGGNAATLTTYTMLINIAVAICVPVFLPFITSNAELSILHAALQILRKVFPLLIFPFLTAALLHWYLPRWAAWFAHFHNLSFYLWSVGLALAIAVTTRSIVHSQCTFGMLLGIAIASAISCVCQFAFGSVIGNKHHDPISAAQACGQKNTIFAIWMGYTFLDPITSLAGGFYSIWHNVYNSYQLYQQRKE